MIRTLLFLLATGALLAQGPEQRVRQHRASNPSTPAPEPGAETVDIPSLVTGLRTKDDWYSRKRPEVMALWTQILGKVEPSQGDKKWFGDIRQARVVKEEDAGSYRRISLELPMEKDFYQPHLLLIPKGQTGKKLPAVICWTSTTPDYKEPERWWGKWLAERGYVVLTGWSFIRNYRDSTDYHHSVAETLYARFGHWLPMAKMVDDARREAEFLKSRPEVDGDRIGFMGFSLSAKAAVYVGAFAPEFKAVIAMDPHIAVNGGTNWFAPWYLDWQRPFPDIPTPQHTVLSLLNPDPKRPGFEHDHHELLALAAPKPFLLIGGCASCEDNGGDSDDQQSWGYVNRAREVYRLLGASDRLSFVLTNDGHHANGPAIDPAWQSFIQRWLPTDRNGQGR